ncbi:MAG: cytosine permease [Marinobacter sp. T13-3]|nr:MAG: cytosine permease [Marinobacter sp. T13-3]
MIPTASPREEDYPLNRVPVDQRKSAWSMGLILLGFTFFTASMWAGGSVGQAFDFATLLMVLAVGNLLLAIYAAVLGYIAAKTGMNTALLSRFSFGKSGSKLTDLILLLTQIGWYAWGTATMATLLVELTGMQELMTTPLMLVFGFGFCVTASIGYRALAWLSRLAVPAMIILIGISMALATSDAGGFSKLAHLTPTDDMTVATAITLVFGTFVAGATQSTNWTRFARSGKTAAIITLLAFFIGNGLMMLVGAFGALVYQETDIVGIMTAQGLLTFGILMLFLNLWTTQDNIAYNFSVVGCDLLGTGRRESVTIAGAAISTTLAVLGMQEWLIPFLVLLGTFIPPIGGVIMASYFSGHKRRYGESGERALPAFNLPGLTAYAIGSAVAVASPWVAPIVGVVVAAFSFTVLQQTLEAVRIRRRPNLRRRLA